MLDYAVQRKEGQKGVGQWEDFGVGAGFQVGLEEWIIELKKEGEGKIQPASSICRGTRDLPSSSHLF